MESNTIDDFQEHVKSRLREGDDYVIASIQRSLEYARLRCSTVESLIQNATDASHPAHYDSIKILVERTEELTKKHRLTLRKSTREALVDEYRKSLPRELRPRTDRLIANLCVPLGDKFARELALPLATHRLRTRRKAALSVIRRIGTSPDDVSLMRTAWDRFKDPDALFVLTRMANGLSNYNCCDLLQENSRSRGDWDAGYLQAVILERFSRDNQLDHSHAASHHPIPYLRAAGRIGDPNIATTVKQVIESLDHPDHFKLAASVVGRMRAPELISIIEARLVALRI